MTGPLPRPSVRAAFAALLWLVGLTPFVLFAVSLDSPAAAVALAAGGETVLGWALLAAGVGAGVALCAYPPFVPMVRLYARQLRTRMSVAQGPMLGALARLEHLETAPDHLIVARTRLNMGNLQRALPHLVRAAQLEPDGVEARFLLGKVCRQLGQLPAAVEQLSFVVGRDEGHAYGQALLELARALAGLGRDDDALAVLARHEAAFDEHREAFLARASILARRGARDEARRLLERAARAPEEGKRIPLEDALARARARVALWRGGRA